MRLRFLNMCFKRSYTTSGVFMIDESLLKKLKIGNLQPEFLDKLEDGLEELQGILPPKILDPEKTLYELHKHIKKQKRNSKAQQKALEDAEKMILSIAGLAHARAGQIQPRETREERKERRFRGVDSLIEVRMLQSKITSQVALTLKESKEQLTEGNMEFRIETERYQHHHEPVKAVQEYDAVVLICSDARDDPSLFRDFVDNDILFIQVAGNLYDPKDAVAKTQLDTALRKLKQGGELIVVGHSKCGAVDANAHAGHYVGKVSGHVDMLVEAVDRRHTTPQAKDDYQANAINQAMRLAEHPIVFKKRLQVVPCLFDFTNGEDKLLTYLKDGTEPPLVTSLRASGISRLKYANDNHYALASQYSHAIVVSDPFDLGRFSNSRMLFNARLNELFAVSAFGKGLSTEAIASIEYALLKVNGVKDAPHIVITHSNPETAEELKQKMLKASKIIRDKTKNGAMITIMQYDPQTHAVSVVS